MSKTITFEQLKEQIQNGDFVYMDFDNNIGHKGWNIVCGNDRVAGFTTEINGSWGKLSDALSYENGKILKYVPISEVNGYYLANFLHTKDESHISSFLYDVIPPKSKKEIELENLIEKLRGQLNDAIEQLETIRGR